MYKKSRNKSQIVKITVGKKQNRQRKGIKMLNKVKSCSSRPPVLKSSELFYTASFV